MRPHLGGIVTPSSYHFFKASPTPCCKKHQAPAGTRLHVTVPHTSELVTRAASLDSAAWDDSLERQGFCFGNWWQSVDLEIPWDKPSQIGWPYYFHTISILFPIHLCGCLRTIWITTVQTLKIVLQAKHPDGHGSSLTACCRGCSFLSRRIPWVSLPGILGVPGVRVPRGPGVPGFFLGPLRRSPWPGRSRGIHKGYA